MVLPLYLAMTAAEMQNCEALPHRAAWMACHFSPYSSGISNVPENLPPGSMLILNDRIPPQGHDPALVAEQLAQAALELEAGRLLLDFQRPFDPALAQVVQAAQAVLPCPLAVTVPYAAQSHCALLLAPRLHKPLAETLSQWPGREIWLEAALECERWTVTTEGSRREDAPMPEKPLPFHRHELLHLNYRTEVSPEQVCFTLWREEDQLQSYLQAAAGLGVACAVGLYQQLGKNENPAG